MWTYLCTKWCVPFIAVCCKSNWMQNALIWDGALCCSCKNRRFGVMYSFHHKGDKNRQTRYFFLRSVLRLLVAILVTLMMEAIHSFETSVLTRATRRHTPEDCTIHRHRRENLKSYIIWCSCFHRFGGYSDVMSLRDVYPLFWSVCFFHYFPKSRICK
jgi:hypothetical protein